MQLSAEKKMHLILRLQSNSQSLYTKLCGKILLGLLTNINFYTIYLIRIYFNENHIIHYVSHWFLKMQDYLLWITYRKFIVPEGDKLKIYLKLKNKQTSKQTKGQGKGTNVGNSEGT